MIKFQRTQKKVSRKIFHFSSCSIHVFAFASLSIHFQILKCTFKVQLSMSSLKKMHSLVSNNHYSTQTLRPFFKNFVIVFQEKYFSRYLCVIFCLRMKTVVNLFISLAFVFLPGSFYQFCTSNCRKVFNFLQI